MPVTKRPRAANAIRRPALDCLRKFRRFFPGGFADETYLDWEREYKVEAHERWQEVLSPARFRALMRAEGYGEIAAAAARVESRTRHPMLFSFEKMALRDAIRTPAGARIFAEGLYTLLHGAGSMQTRFERWRDAVARLPRKQTRVLTWPMVTVWGFLAQPRRHLFVKPRVIQAAAEAYGFEFDYVARPNWKTYSRLLELAATVRADLSAAGPAMTPRDMIDIQSFLWVQGSEEYA
jgi:hypothetical protein